MEEMIFNLSDAADYLGVTQVTLRKKIRDGDLAAQEDPLDTRQKLVKRSDLNKFLIGRGVTPDEALKALEDRREARKEVRARYSPKEDPALV
jgi:excisionase family DNA binding protein